MPLTFSQLILHGANRLNTPPPPPLRRPPCQTRLAIGTLKIRDGRGLRLVQAIRAVEIGGVEVMLMTETKIQTEAYSQNRLV